MVPVGSGVDVMAAKGDSGDKITLNWQSYDSYDKDVYKRQIEYQFNKAQEEVKTVKKKTDCEIKKLKNEAKEKETFWMIAYMILVLLAVIKNTVFQKDLFACIIVPLRFWYRYIEWLIHPSELNILGEREYFSAGDVYKRQYLY